MMIVEKHSSTREPGRLTAKTWAVRMATATLVLGILSDQTQAQPRISNDTVKLGVLTDMSSIYADNSGPGSVAAAQMAVADFGGTVLGKKIEVVSADNLNKADVGASVTREWIDRDGVDAIVDVPNSAVAFAVQEITRAKDKVFLATGTASSRLTADICSPTTVHWTYDTYALANGTGRAVVEAGGDTWFFIAADFAVGAALQRDTEAVVKSGGGRVLGSVRHPINSPDFASLLLQAQASKAKIIGLATAGGDMINLIKQSAEFGVAKGGQSLAGLLVFIADIHSLGLQPAQGMYLTAAFYWDLNDQTRAWSKKFAERYPKVPTMIHAGTYGAVMHYPHCLIENVTEDPTPMTGVASPNRADVADGETDQHGRAARGGVGSGGALRGGRTAREGAHPGRTDGDDGLASQARGTSVVGRCGEPTAAV
jgi:branched-chain amino acid transport system substrate-binding protein